MKIKPWMWIAAGLAALLFLKKAKAKPPELMVQKQNLFVDP